MSFSNETQSTGLGLFQSFFQPHQIASFTNASQQVPDQMLRNFARWQLEVQGLMVRRAQAYLELPARLSQCRTPQDVLAEQQRFVQTCLAHYSEGAQHAMSAWVQMFQFPAAATEALRSKADRDYLSFPETRPLNGTGGESQQYGADRKVA